MATCSHCDKPIWSNGLCRFHDGRARTGVALDAPFGGKKPSVWERFWRCVDIEPGGCWIWKAGKSRRGYGKFWHNDYTWLVYKWAFENLVGPVPKGLTLDHLCRNRLCVNPAHLEPVSAVENVMRGTGITAVNAKKTHCSKGHPFSGYNVAFNKDGSRRCRECARLHAAKAKHLR